MVKKIVPRKGAEKRKYYGIVSLKKGVKASWISKEDKNGWSLGLGLNSRTVWLTGLRFTSESEIDRVTRSLGRILTELKGK